MSWAPRHGHVSQLHAGPGGVLSGWNDCWEACLARYLCERDHTLALLGDLALIDRVSRAARGAADAPDNADTSLGDAAASLRAFGLPVHWTASYQDALAAPWAICLVDGTLLAPPQYPAAWFGTPAPGGNHFILWLPFWQGSANWFDDPLAYGNGQHDCLYASGSVAAAFYGAYLLPDTGNGEGSGANPTTGAHLLVAARCALKLQPNHTCIAVATLAAGMAVTALSGIQDGWQRVRTADGIGGWLPCDRLRVEGGALV